MPSHAAPSPNMRPLHALLLTAALAGVDISGADVALPSIDARAALRGDLAELAAFDKGMREYGFVTLHNVTAGSAAVGLDEAARTFFRLPLEAKMRRNEAAAYGAAGGYTPPGVESVARTSSGAAAPPDPVENIVWRSPPDPVGAFEAAGAEYWSDMASALEAVHAIAAAALGLEADVFAKHYAADAGSLRLAYYPPSPTRARTRYGAHTDYQGFTLLTPDAEVGGLEVQAADGTWVPVAAPPLGSGALVVNAGDLIEVWTNGRWRSALHRVVGEPDAVAVYATAEEVVPAAAELERLSLVFFSGPRDDVLVEPLPLPAEGPPEGGRAPLRFEPVVAGAWLRAKLAQSNV